jgi:hypothetical protein
VGSDFAVGGCCRAARDVCVATLGFGSGLEATAPLVPVGELAGRAVTGAGVAAAVCVGDGVRPFEAGVLAVPGSGAAGAFATTGASGLGVAAAVPPVAGGVAVGAEAIRGDASLRGPVGGLSGAGADAAKDGPASARASVAAHAEAHTPLRRSVCRRDDVPVDIRPSLSR